MLLKEKTLYTTHQLPRETQFEQYDMVQRCPVLQDMSILELYFVILLLGGRGV